MEEIEELRENTRELRAWEIIMMDCFTERNLSELDKRCWLVVEAYATIEQDQIPKVRVGELPEIKLRKEEEGVEAEEEKEETEPEKMEVEKEEEPKEKKEEPEEEELKNKGKEEMRLRPRMISRNTQRAGPPEGDEGRRRHGPPAGWKSSRRGRVPLLTLDDAIS